MSAHETERKRAAVLRQRRSGTPREPCKLIKPKEAIHEAKH